MKKEKKKDAEKRISFTEHYATHIYELCLRHFQRNCGSCGTIKERLEKFMGRKSVNWVKRQVKRRPYCYGTLPRTARLQ